MGSVALAAARIRECMGGPEPRTSFAGSAARGQRRKDASLPQGGRESLSPGCTMQIKNPSSRLSCLSLRVAALCACSPLALAGTWIVDAAGGAGSQFTDIQPALNAALDGDIVLVKPGSYSNFVLRESILVIGQGPGVIVGQASIFSLTKVEGVTQGKRAGLADLVIQGHLTVQDCAREVVLDEIELPKGMLTVKNCGDVRLRGCSVVGPDGSNGSDPFSPFLEGGMALRVDAARVEVAECTLRGGNGGDCSPCQADGGFGGDGGSAIAAINAAEVHVARSNLTGGTGGDASPAALFVGAYGGVGGNALNVGFYSAPNAANLALVSGSPEQELAGGMGGKGMGLGGGGQQSPGKSVRVWGMAQARTSGIALPNGVQVDLGGFHEIAVPNDPTLRIVAAPKAGENATFRVHAVPGSSVTVLLGRDDQIVPQPGLAEDLLIVPVRFIDLGVVDGSGVISVNQPLPASLGSGFVLHAQATVVMPLGDQRYTNSLPMLLR